MLRLLVSRAAWAARLGRPQPPWCAMAALSGKARGGVARKRQTARGSGFSQGSVGGSPSLIDQADDLALLRETVQLLFGEDERAVIGNLEHAAAGRLQGQVGDLA